MTQALSVRCQNCGSPLQVGDSIRFITCGYCHTELQVVRDASTVHTEVLGRIEQNTQTAVSQLKVIEIQNDLDLLDREWQQWRENNLGHDKAGTLVEPGRPVMLVKQSFVGSLMISIFTGLMLMALFLFVNMPGQMVMLGLLGPPLLIIILHVHNTSALCFARSKSTYEKERATLLRKLAQARDA